MRHGLTRRSLVCTTLFLAAEAAAATAPVLVSTEAQVTFEADEETTPTLGADAVSPLVVYTTYEGPVGYASQSDIYLQRLVDGQPYGPRVAIAATPYHERLADVSGDYVAYTWYESLTSSVGRIVIHQLSTGQTRDLGSAADRWYPKICNGVVIWLRATAEGNLVMRYDLDWGEPVVAQALVGPVPNPKDIELGDRFVVWSALVDQQYDLGAYDLQTGVTFSVAADPVMDERMPATSGPWIVYQLQEHSGATSIALHAVNVDTGEHRVVADNGAFNGLPSIDGNLVSWESTVTGGWDVFVHRLAEGDTFQVTALPLDQRLNDVFGNLVAYVDSRNGNADVFVSTLEFVVPDPCAEAGGDADADGVCSADDNCAALANPDQADADGDGVGDACEIVLPGDPAALCALQEPPDGVSVLFRGEWGGACTDDDRAWGRCGSIDERVQLAAPEGTVALFCLAIAGASGPGQSHAPSGFVAWNQEHVFDNLALRDVAAVGVAEARAENALRVKLQLDGPLHDSSVALAVLAVPEATAAEYLETNCASAPSAGGWGLGALAALGLRRRRRA